MIQLSQYINSETLHVIEESKHDDVLHRLISMALPDYPQQVHDRAFAEVAAKGDPRKIHLGNGFALVHARMNDFNQIGLALGLFGQEIKVFKGEAVHTLLCIMIPVNMSRTYMTLLARVSRFFSNPEVQAAFASADVDAIIKHTFEFDAV